jgi:hypothetical protein
MLGRWAVVRVFGSHRHSLSSVCVRADLGQHRAARDHVAEAAAHRLHRRVERRGDVQLHLHRFEHDHDLPGDDAVAGAGTDRDDLAHHRRGQLAARRRDGADAPRYGSVSKVAGADAAVELDGRAVDGDRQLAALPAQCSRCATFCGRPRPRRCAPTHRARDRAAPASRARCGRRSRCGSSPLRRAGRSAPPTRGRRASAATPASAAGSGSAERSEAPAGEAAIVGPAAEVAGAQRGALVREPSQRGGAQQLERGSARRPVAPAWRSSTRRVWKVEVARLGQREQVLQQRQVS